jgi:ubiquinone/menaquinone biosynthesis C-methylase UbiE
VVVSLDDVRAYYRSFDQREWERLDRAEGIIEFAVNTHFLQAHLPPHGHVLDLGGGPGRYAAWLAERGYQVTLADLSPNLPELARRRLPPSLLEEIVEADARDLTRWPDDSFDATLVFGPCTTSPMPETESESFARCFVLHAQAVQQPSPSCRCTR